MYRFITTVAALMLTVSVHSSWAQSFSCTFDAGSVQVKRGYSSAWAPLHNGEEVGVGDSLKFKTADGALISLSESAAIVVKDNAQVSIGGSADNLIFNLDEGEVFLSRDKGVSHTPVWIMAKACSFSPVGTKAAVKITPDDNPSVAVVEGKMKATDPAGHTLDISNGNFATFDKTDRSFRQGTLAPEAVERINSWSEKNLERQPKQVAMNTAESEGESQEAEGAEQEAANDNGDTPEEVVGEPTEKVMQMQESESPATNDQAEASEQKQDKPAEKAKAKKKPKKQSVSHTGAAPQRAKPMAQNQPGTQEPQDESTQAENSEVPAGDGATAAPMGGAGGGGTTYGVSAGAVTIGDEQWTRIAFLIDVPIWRFGVAFDIELFLNSKMEVDKKGWDFSKDQWAETLLRKIRYIRFNREDDPVFIKFGGLSSVTMGYGFVVDRFTNMLNYPDEKLLGLQFDLNDISPLGITLQTLIADIQDFSRDGGIMAARLGVKPLKPSNVPVLKNLLIAGTYATDLNQYAPARDWKYDLPEDSWDRDGDGITDSTFYFERYGHREDWPIRRAEEIEIGDFDTIIEHKHRYAETAENGFSIVGGDASLPVISSKIFGLDIYGQAALNMDYENDDDDDKTRGWGIGASGVAANIGPFRAQVEYRHINGQFEPGYFGPFYMEERIVRDSIIKLKEDNLEKRDRDVKGVFGSLGMDIANVFVLRGSYQRLIGDKEENGLRALDQRFEVTGSIGNLLIEKIPKINKAEIFLSKTRIQRTEMNPIEVALGEKTKYDGFFQRTPNMYWGYRLGGEITAGASLIWETRYGWKFKNGKLVEDNNVTIAAGMSF
ncbi:MAG: hypothetical protein ACOC4C_00530 [Fibrobacterota bacterium]